MEASKGLEIVDLQVSTFVHFPWCIENNPTHFQNDTTLPNFQQNV